LVLAAARFEDEHAEAVLQDAKGHEQLSLRRQLCRVGRHVAVVAIGADILTAEGHMDRVHSRSDFNRPSFVPGERQFPTVDLAIGEVDNIERIPIRVRAASREDDIDRRAFFRDLQRDDVVLRAHRPGSMFRQYSNSNTSVDELRRHGD
jgi:hypothetical protein